MSFKSEPIQVPFQGDNISIMEVQWTPDALVVSIRSRSTGEEAEVRFPAEFAPNKFRLVDEADLNDWTNIAMCRSWLYSITSGGWLAYESQKEGFLGKHGNFDEYLVVGTDECVSVLSKSSPVVEIRST